LARLSLNAYNAAATPDELHSLQNAKFSTKEDSARRLLRDLNGISTNTQTSATVVIPKKNIPAKV